MNFQSVVLNVADLDRSLEFYQGVYAFTLLSKKDQLAAMYTPGSDTTQVIVLRSIGAAAGRRVSGAMHVGIRALVLEVGMDELERITAELDKRGALAAKHGDGETWTAAFGLDPDKITIVAGASLSDQPIPLEAWAALNDALYGIGA